MAQVSSDTIATYWPYLERTAKRYVGWNGAELDDLVQEGAIATWLYLESGWPYCPALVWHRGMSNYCRSLRTGGWRLSE